MLRVEYADLAWIEAPMPDGSGPIELGRLPRLPDGHFRVFGRFPAGWSRTVHGHYPVFEEILLLEGDLAIGRESWTTGGYAWVAARELRELTTSRDGCVAFARFGGRGLWTPGEASEPPDEPPLSLADVRSTSGVLHAAAAERSLLVQDAADVPAHDGLTEWLSLADRTWCCTEPGEPAPALAGPLFVRLVPGG